MQAKVDSKQISEMFESLKAASSGIVLEGQVANPSRRPSVPVTADEMKRIIDEIKPRIVYLSIIRFDLESEIAAIVRASKAADEAECIAELARRTKQPERRNGTTIGVCCVVFADGVLHAYDAEVDWIALLREGLRADLAALVLERADAGARSLGAEIRQQALKLMDDARFSAPKTSKAKRDFLCAEIFPHLPARTVDRVVTEAENLIWFQSTAPEAPKEAGEAAPGARKAEAA